MSSLTPPLCIVEVREERLLRGGTEAEEPEPSPRLGAG